MSHIDPLAVESFPAGVCQVDRQRRVQFANARFCELTGYGRQELADLRLTDLLDAGGDADGISGLGGGARDAREQELLLRRKDGERLWVRLQSAALRDRSGSVAGALLLCSDITDRKRTEESQTRLQQRVAVVAREWQLTFDAVTSPILLLDPRARVLRMNRAAMELSGRSYAENLMRRVDGLGPGEPWRAASEIVRRVLASGGPAEVSVEDARAGRTWDLAASLVAREDREEHSIIAVAKDVSELVALQRSLRRSEMMSAMGSLVAGVAHEVRNPLFAMSATLDAFEACCEMEPDVGEYVKILRAELGRMGNLMRDLLEYGRPVEPRLVPGSICRTIRQAAEACAAQAAQAEVEIAVAIAPGLPQLLLDELRMVQVFKNLLENAVHFSSPGGRVEIEARQDGAWVECTVRDHGPGFREEDLPRIFEPFFSRRRGGTGLGLALVQRIVEEHGGRVRCSNQPTGGGLVTVRLAARSGPQGES